VATLGATDGGTKGGETPKDRRYLELHHGSWRVVIGHREGGKVIKLKRSLGTASLREAQRLRWPVVAQLKVLARRQSVGGQPADAEAWKAALKANTGGWGDPEAALADHLDRLPPARAAELATQVYQTHSPSICPPSWPVVDN
jgi:hypothetical protein